MNVKKIIFLTNKNFNIKKIFLFYKINFLSFAIVKNSLSLSPIYNKKKKIQLQSINLAFLEEDPIPKNLKQIKKKEIQCENKLSLIHSSEKFFYHRHPRQAF